MGRNLKFPNPNDRKLSKPAILCPAERVLKLYNQDSGDTAQRIAEKVKDWFKTQAHKIGWGGVQFLDEVESDHGAGCVLWLSQQPVSSQMKNTTNQFVLYETDLDDGDETDGDNKVSKIT